ncbi:amidohydrolase family protein [Terrarubrum flagellatum]|uniref:metal-dependent hydrolase family protein n=1 Tax=Terrirubrum flagellatum TaxID=2895980 RepID=UPI00314525D1
MRTLYRGGLVFDGAESRESHGVMVEGVRIARVAPLTEFDGFSDRVVDTSGATLMPGVIDAHTHIMLTGGPDQLGPLETLPPVALAFGALKHAQDALMGGVTSLRDVGGKNFIEMQVRDAIARGDFVGPTIQCSGHIICITGGHAYRIGRQADGVDEIVKAVREQIRAGADLIKLMATGGMSSANSDPGASQFTEAEINAACAEAQRQGKPTAAHAHGRGGVLNAVRAGITSIEHGAFIDAECIEEMIKRGVFLVPTLSVSHWTEKNAEGGSIPQFIIEKTQKSREARRKNFKAFYDAGGKIAMGTDGGTQYNYHRLSAYELALMVESGMTAKDALIAGTSAAAELMRMPDRGRIAEGCFADLLVVDGDPVKDIANAALAERHRLVVKNGVEVKRRA